METRFFYVNFWKIAIHKITINNALYNHTASIDKHYTPNIQKNKNY